MKKYEYKTVEIKNSHPNEEWKKDRYAKIGSEEEVVILNKYGQEGWELCNTESPALGGYYLYYFKRELS